MKQRIAIILVIFNLSLGMVASGSLNPVTMAEKSGLFEQFNLVCTTDPVVTNDFDNGAESLRQAVADACPGSTITFDLTGTIQLSSGNITIDKNLIIQGPGANVLTVENIAAQSATSRIFYVNAGVTATIAGITISGGDVTGDGAGIYNNGTLTIINSIISNNTMVGDGGGIYNNGTLTVIGSTISSNGKTTDSITGISRVGGGIYNHGTLTVTGSTIHDNLSFPPPTFNSFIGGGIYNDGIANISNSTFSNNRAAILFAGGGAITNVPGGTLTVTDSIFDSNSGFAGSIYNFASTMNITNSTFTNNTGRRGGAIYSFNGAATVTNSTISNNHIDNNFGNGGGGGGIYIDFGTMTLTNSTVENNRSDGPISSANNGGGIYITDGTLNITNSTIANNTAMRLVSQGGGIYRSGGTVNSRNSIIAGNTAAAGGRDFFGSLNSQGYNLIGSTANTTVTGITTGNILNQDPLLLPLADNGGPTQTLALQPNSPAIDAGDSSGSTTDQRGVVRPSDQAPANVSDGADIGAFELSPNTTITAHPTDPSNSSSASFSFTVTNGIAFAGFQCNLDNSGFTACASPQTYNLLPDGSHTFTVRAVDNAGSAVGPLPSFTWTIDTAPPDTTFDNNPDNPSAPNVGFRFSGTDSGTGIAGFECDLDGGGFSACTSPKTFYGLTQGSHTFRVRAIDAAGNVDPTPASFTWNVDRICTINPVVSSRIEGDDGSLRLVVTNACAGGTITFNVTGRIRLSSGQITLDKNLTIQGPGAHLLEVRNTAATSRVFLVNSGVTVTIAGLTITGGNVSDIGGSIYNNGTLTVTNSIISNNSANLGGGIYNLQNSILNVANSTIENNAATRGGGIYNATGTVNVTNSTIYNNNVKLVGGGIYNDGILTLGVLTVTNSTISNNTVGLFADAVGGGGIYNNNDGTVNLTNSTITNNSELAAASFGGGINNLNGGTVNCRNTIIAGNTGTGSDFFGTLTSQGYNLIGSTGSTTIVGDTTGNILNQNALLAPLADNGGPTQTHALLTGSPAIDAGDSSGSMTDQRGATRPFDQTPANVSDGADIGAFELNNSMPTPTPTVTPTPTLTPTPTPNTPPTAANASYGVNEDSALNTPAPGVLTNDSDGENNALTAQLQTSPAHAASFALNADGSFSYTPNPNFNGSDSFTYTASDGSLSSNAATVTITVNSVNDNPDAMNDSATVAEDSGANAINILGNDSSLPDTGETLIVSSVTNGANGAVAITDGGTNVSYTPNANFNGTDSFTYTISDGNGGSNAGTVSVTVTSVNDNPDAVNDTATAAEDSGANIVNVRGNDSISPDTGETLTVTAVTQGTNGSVAITNSGADVSYTPNANFSGTDSFTYIVSDGNGGSDTATVNVTVTPVNDNPIASDDSATVAEDSGANSFNVLSNDSILPDAGETLTVTGVTQGTNGTVAITNGGTRVSYTPAANYFGSDSFTYTISDGNGGSDTATVNVTVTPVNDAPTINSGTITRQQTVPGTSSTIATVMDVDNIAGSLTVVTTSVPAGITVTSITNTNGTITATVAAGCNAAVGANNVGLKVTDSNGAMGTGTLTVNVTKETTPPVINPISNVTAQLPPNSNVTSMAVTFPLPTGTDNCGGAVIVTTNPVSGSTFNLGTTTVNVTATDQAGNQSFATFTVTVLYRFSMFQYSDLLLSETELNQVTAGSTLPVRFTLSGFKGNPYSSPPTSQRFNCSTNALIGAATVINRTLPDPQYDATFDFYQTTWKTEAAWKFQCRRLTLSLKDGTTRTLKFYFK